MRDLNYFPMNVESNIYGMTVLEFSSNRSKVLVATLDCQIYCITYNDFKPQTREVEFTYIPNGAKIISIGALKRGPNDFVIGITHSVTPDTQKSSGFSRSGGSLSSRDTIEYAKLTNYYLNIYASDSVMDHFDLDYVAQGCQTIRLRYVPYHLYYTEVVTVTKAASSADYYYDRKPLWLLSGGDNCIHAFCEDRPFQSFNEIPIDECYPELSKIGGLALWIDVLNLIGRSDGHERVTALGLEDGSVKLYHSVLSVESNSYVLVKESCFDSYTTIIPSVRLFQKRSRKSCKLRSYLQNENVIRANCDERLKDLELLVVSSTNSCLIFENILEHGLEKFYELPDSQRVDCSMTSAINDMNFDGYNELLLGTYGRELLTYEYDKDTESYKLARIHELNHSVYSISLLDLTGDATREVAILLSSGVLVMQVEVDEVVDICKRRMELILEAISTKTISN